jgi:Bax protein
MNLHHIAIEFFRTNRAACLIGIAALIVAAAVYLIFGIDHGGLRSPEDSAALELVAQVSLLEIRKTSRVPPAFVTRIDVDLSAFTAKDRKQAFFRIVLPLVARENDRIRTERELLMNDPSTLPDALFLRYDAVPGDIDTLRRRVDIIPASMVLAQAALESGWGTSRFALDGNNLFGMRTYDNDAQGLTPAAATGFKVRRFKSLGGGVAAYIRNLNTHAAYRELRNARAALRRAGKRPTGPDLTAWLKNYSEIPEEYGQLLRTLIAREKLTPFDHVRLSLRD